jgi:hypothetical protein
MSLEGPSQFLGRRPRVRSGFPWCRRFELDRARSQPQTTSLRLRLHCDELPSKRGVVDQRRQRTFPLWAPGSVGVRKECAG